VSKRNDILKTASRNYPPAQLSQWTAVPCPSSTIPMIHRKHDRSSLRQLETTPEDILDLGTESKIFHQFAFTFELIM